MSESEKTNRKWVTSMPDSVYDFLKKIGFTFDDIEEFCTIECDGFDGKGDPFFGNDIIFAVTLEDEESVDLQDTGELIEAYWEKAWHSGFCTFHRSNFDSYKGRYYKAFPTRYKLWEFKFTKALRRILKKNSDLKTVIRPLRITPEKSDLFDTYNYLRYGHTPREELRKAYEYIKFYPSKLTELCVFKENKLIACSIFEVGNFSMYSNACFWDLSEKARSLGTFTILLEIRYALELKMAYYYLGNFYVQNPNYHYKARFRGLELWDWENGYWLPFESHRTKELLKEKLPRRKS